jgi:DNA (cytosine-5)-methyltransferase 1
MIQTKPQFRFVDLFAGIGGFHAALSALGGECVYAVEIDAAAAAVYERNWGLDPLGDITVDATATAMNVPEHDVLAAGFPCQPFSKSGAQRGMDEARGTLFWNIARIIEVRRPAVVLLENVRNLAGPRHLHEWAVIVKTLRDLGYRVADRPAVFSPHLLPPQEGGRPQVRERVFITATRLDRAPTEVDTNVLPVAVPKAQPGWDPQNWNLERDLPLDPDHHAEGCELSSSERLWIDAWDDFVTLMWEAREGQRLPGFPIWADDWVLTEDLQIPAETPKWKTTFLRKNADFYTAHKRLLDQWANRWGVYTDRFPPSRRKFEWQAQDTPRLWDCVMHMRPSGIRAKRATYLPALVAITQTSIIGSRERRLSPREAARLQGFADDYDFGTQPAAATYKQLGNAVNVGVVRHILREHIRRDSDILTRSHPSLVAAALGGVDQGMLDLRSLHKVSA